MTHVVDKKRRGFLALLGTAPIAAPVALKEAAAQMGVVSSAGPLAVHTADLIGASACQPSIGNNSWVAEAIKQLASPQKQAEFNERAKRDARLLDPDLAACRSLSVSAAYRLQVERCRKRIEANERSWLLSQLDSP